jgi:hypothetical protein
MDGYVEYRSNPFFLCVGRRARINIAVRLQTSRRSKVPANPFDKTLRTAQLRRSEDGHLLTLIRIHRSLGLAGKDRSRP